VDLVLEPELAVPTEGREVVPEERFTVVLRLLTALFAALFNILPSIAAPLPDRLPDELLLLNLPVAPTSGLRSVVTLFLIFCTDRCCVVAGR
jgi:hypothetical protein